MTEAEQKELEQLELEELEAEAALEGAAAPATPPEPSTVDRVLSFLDVGRGIVGAPIQAKIQEAITGKKAYDPKEHKAAILLEKPMPEFADLLERTNPELVPAGGVGRLAMNMVGGAATDPTSYLPMLGQMTALGRLAKLIRAADIVTSPVSHGISAGGKQLWRSAFKDLDVVAKNKGKASKIIGGKKVDIRPSTTLMEMNTWSPFSRNVLSGMAENSGKLLDTTIDMDKAATVAGARVDIPTAQGPLKNLRTKFAGEQVGFLPVQENPLPRNQAVLEKIDEALRGLDQGRPRAATPDIPATFRREVEPTGLPWDPYSDNVGSWGDIPTQTRTVKVSDAVPGTPAYYGLTPSQARESKTLAAKGVSAKGRDPFKVDEAADSMIAKAEAEGLQKAVEDVMPLLGAGKKETYQELNARLGAILASQDKLANQVTREELQNFLTSIDGMIIGAPSQDMSANLGMLAVKKAADLSKLRGVRSTLGKGMTQLTTPVLGRTLARGPWSLLAEDPLINIDYLPEEEKF